MHTLPPRFIGEILHTYAGNGGYEIRDADWIDPKPDASAAAQLIRSP